jgi:PAS domain S-box-containing protein
MFFCQKMNNLKIIIFVFLIHNSIIFPCFANNTAQQQSNKIIVGTEQNYPPYSYLKNGVPSGFNVDITRAIAGASGIKIEIDYRPWAEIRNDLEKGKIHAICGMYYSKQRDKLVDFSPPYAVINHAIFTRKNSPEYITADELTGKQIIVMQGDIMHDYVIQKKLTQNPVLVKDQAEALKLLSSGQHDCALIAELPGLYWIKQLKISNLMVNGKPILASKYCFAVKEDDSELLFRLSEGLAIINQSGQYKEIYDHWLGVLKTKTIALETVIQYAVITLLSIFILLLVSLFWFRSLKKQVSLRTAELETEIIERKKIQEALSEKEAFLETLINAIPIPIFYKDKNGNYIGFNRSFETFFGKSKKELVGKSVFDINPPDLADIYNKKDLELFETQKLQQYESQVKNTKGEIRDVVFNKDVFTNSKGEVLGLIGGILDITDRKLFEKEREKLIAELKLALSEVKKLSGLLPICSHCKKIRDDKGYWNQIEGYIQSHSDAKFSHGICQECAKKYYPDMDLYNE